MSIFVANLGNRDIWFNLGTPDDPDFVTFKKWDRADEISEMLECDPGTRACISALVDEYPDRYELLSLLRFPILQPALNCALDHCRERDETLNRVILMATDQDPQEEPDHYPWDTIEAARLLKELLPLQEDFQPHLDSNSIDIFPISSNPQRFDDAYRHLGDLFREFENEKINVYASVKGGIPALNEALRIRALNSFGPRAHLIETDEPSGEEKRRGRNGESFLVDSWPYRRDALVRIARDLLNTYEYDGLLDVLNRELSVDEKDRFQNVFAFLQHAAARFNFNIEGAKEALSAQPFNSGKAAQWRNSVKRDAMDLQRLYELMWTTNIVLERRDYRSFVVRVTTIAEISRRQLATLFIGFRPGRTLAFGDLPTPMKRWLRKQDLTWAGNRPIANTHLLNAVIEWSKDPSNNSEDADLFEDAHRLISELEELEQLRNKVVHRARGVSEDELNEAFPNCHQRFPNRMEKLLEAMTSVHRSRRSSTYVVSDIYDELNERVLTELRTG